MHRRAIIATNTVAVLASQSRSIQAVTDPIPVSSAEALRLHSITGSLGETGGTNKLQLDMTLLQVTYLSATGAIVQNQDVPRDQVFLGTNPPAIGVPMEVVGTDLPRDYAPTDVFGTPVRSIRLGVNIYVTNTDAANPHSGAVGLVALYEIIREPRAA